MPGLPVHHQLPGFTLTHVHSVSDAIQPPHPLLSPSPPNFKLSQLLDFIPIPKKGNAKECSNYYTVALISHASKVMLKILQARLQQYVNCELPDVQSVLEKAGEPEIKLPTSAKSLKNQESSRKTSISALLTTPEPLTVWITINCGKV